MTARNNILLIFGIALASVSFACHNASAEDPPPSNFPFGKEPGSIYLGGTAGLSGIDSVRGHIDSLFYSKWTENYDPNYTWVSPSVIYGEDDRRDIYTLTDPNLLKLAQATCVQVSGSEISDNGDGTYTLNTAPWETMGGLPLCDGERFAGQLRLGRCSAFLVAEDIVVTAGHCMSSCGTYAFVFGYQQTDSLTPPAQVVSEDNIYFCDEVLDWTYAGDLDHCVVRLDRPVVGKTPIPIRRHGVVPNASPLIVVGHPIHLPMKAAAGAEVKDNRGSTPWFQANTDTYGGNSGSMVVNTETWQIEGILVRGAPDFVYTDCVASNVVPNSGNPDSGLPFEEISKIETIAHLIPVLVSTAGEIDLSSTFYNCSDQVEIELRDADLASIGSYDLLITSAASDSELVSLAETAPGSAIFTGTVDTESGTTVRYDGRLQVADGNVVTAIYEDADNGTGSPATVEESSDIDCAEPIISNIAVTGTGATWVRVIFSTNETAQGRVWLGSACDNYSVSELGVWGTDHEITLSSLPPSTSFKFMIDAEDLAGNLGQDDNSGVCYDFTTLLAPEYFTELFSAGCDLQGKRLVFLPDGSDDFYELCLYDADDYSDSPAGVPLSLTDDDFEEISVSGGNQVSFYGVGYSTVYVGSNGYVTFGEGDIDFSETVSEHLGSPPRISVFWHDLDPAQGGAVTSRTFVDHWTVTWANVPKHLSLNVVGAQLQLYFDGTIAITYLTVEPWGGLVGLSSGLDDPADYYPSDLSGYADCDLVTCYADTDGDTYGAQGDPGHYEFGPLCGVSTSENDFDCNDNDETIYPEAPEVLDDGVDQDCDGLDASCCQGHVGDANGVGGDVPTIGDISTIIDHLFISEAPLDCYPEADVNQSGGRYPTPDDITIGDVSTLIDHLFISGVPLNDCL